MSVLGAPRASSREGQSTQQKTGISQSVKNGLFGCAPQSGHGNAFA
jgi:hypothetical protein